MQLADLFAPTFTDRCNEPAVVLDDAGGSITLSFGQLQARARHMAGCLQARGLARGDRLALFLPNQLEFLDLFLACTQLGVIVVPVNVLYREREVSHIVADCAPRAVVTTADLAPWVSGAPTWNAADLATEAGDREPFAHRLPLDGDTPAALVYTSGTTGRSKGAVLTHNNFMANAANLIACWRLTSHDRYLATLPLFHVHGLANGVVSWLATGCVMRLVDRFDVARAPAWFRDFSPTVFFGVPTMYVRLLDLPAEDARRIGERMRLFVCGSAPLPAHVLHAFEARYGHTILERYGMSETLMNLSNPYAGERRPGSVGFPLPGVSVRIVSDGADVPDETVGELWVRGPNVCAGYWNRPEATTSAFVDGWFRTGDLAERSPDGYYTLRGRTSDLIISGGFNIYPREIEEVLLEMPGVREAAVVGVPDAARGELPVAYIVVTSPVNPDDLLDGCRRQLASFKIPRGVVLVDELPRTALGKIQKHLLPPFSPSLR